MDRQTVVCTYIGILFSHTKNELPSPPTTCVNLENFIRAKSEVRYKRTNNECFHLHDVMVYMKYLEWVNSYRKKVG